MTSTDPDQPGEPSRARPESHIRRLIAELFWEGPNIRSYRDGGLGKENVLTTEVFLALDYLPRRAFLGRVIAAAHGANHTRQALINQIEDVNVALLPGDIVLAPNAKRRAQQIIVQPDGLIDTPSVAGLLEAKRIRSSAFQPEQLAREYVAAHALAQGRRPFLLLVLGEEPPVKVKGAGRSSIVDAITAHLTAVTARSELPIPAPDLLHAQIEDCVAWTTWRTLQNEAKRARDVFGADDPSVIASVRRLADSLIHAIESVSLIWPHPDGLIWPQQVA